jgi:peptidoglycan/LPS O-acetylase OafA/YrhL
MNAPAAVKTDKKPFVIPSLDGIRALSFLLVFLAHVGTPYIPGGFGVTVFFFLSGYLITTLLRREAEKTGTVSFKLFYLRRALRILPPFYLVLSLALGLTLLGLLPSPFSWPALAAQALHYSNYWIVSRGWDGMLAGTGVYWSLAVEEHFYLLFPALYALMLRAGMSGRGQHAVLFLLCAVILIWRCSLVFGQGIIGDRTYIASDTRFDSMLFGCALAVWGNPAMDFAQPEKPRLLEWLGAAAGIGLLLTTFVVRDPAFRESVRYSMQGLGLYPLFHLMVRHPQLLVARFLNWRPLCFVGTLSYSLYLLHQVVINVVYLNLPAPEVVRAALSLAVSVLLAIAVWRYVEKPCAKLRGRLSAA